MLSVINYVYSHTSMLELTSLVVRFDILVGYF